MLVYINLMLLVCLITFLLQKSNFIILIPGIKDRYVTATHIAFFCDFIILAFFSIIRDGIGIDYKSYIHHIQLIQSGVPHYMEYGFKQLVLFLAKFSTNPRWVLIVLAFFTCLFYLLAMVNLSENLTLSVFLFLTWGYYFFSLNTVRNFFAQSLALVSIIFLADKKYVKFAICIAIASLFHKSALICYPLYLFAQKEMKKKDTIILFLFIIAALIFKDFFRKFVFLFYPRYEGSAYDTGRVSWLNIIKAVLVIAISLLFYKYVKNDPVNRICFNLNVFSFIFYVGLYWTPEISRLGFYMNTTSIILIPRLLSDINQDYENKRIVKTAIVIGSCVLFFLLMQGFYSSTIQLLPYKTWLGGNF